MHRSDPDWNDLDNGVSRTADDNKQVGKLPKKSGCKWTEERILFQGRLLDAVGEALIATDVEGKVLYWNRAAEKLYGWSAEEVVGQTLAEFVVSEDLRVQAAEIRSALKQGKPWSGEFVVQRKDGTSFLAQVTDTPVLDDQGNVVGLIGVSTDVTERERAETRLKESKRRLSTLLSNTPAMVYRCLNEPDWPEEYVSDYALELTGYPASDFLTNPTLFGSLISEEDKRRIWDEVQGAVGRGERFRIHYAIHHKDGSPRFVEELGQAVYDESGGVVALEGLIYDVTDRVRTEERLRVAENRYRTLVEQVPAIVYVQEPNEPSRTTYVSPQNQAILGYSPEECLADPDHWIRIMHPDDRARVLEEDGRTNDSGEYFAMEYRQLAKDGRLVWLRDEATLVRDEGGEPLYWLGLQVDITEHKATEAALRENEERFKRSFDDAAIGMALVAPEGRFLQVNRSLCGILGYPEEELLVKTFQDITHPDDLEKDLGQARRLLTAEVRTYQTEKRYIHKEGHAVWALLNVTLVRDEGDEPLYFVSQIQDISERKRAEEALKEAEERYRTLVEQIPAVTYIDPVDDPDTPLYTSPQIEEMLGYTPEEWANEKLWPERLHPNDRERVLAADERFESGDGEPYSEEYRLIAKDGSVVWVREEAVLVRDEEGKPRFWQGIIRDVTERKEAEEVSRRTEERYRNMVEEQTELVCRFLPDLTLTFTNDAYRRYFGKSSEELVGSRFLYDVHEADHAYYEEQLVRLNPGSPTATVEERAFTPNGVRWLQWTDTAIFDRDGRIVEYQSVGRDVTERREAEERLEHQALHDPLTDLPNRRLFVDRLGQALRRTRRRGNRVAVLFIDLNGFKVVNDSLGHEAGDLLLSVVAARLRRRVRPEDTLARFGGDEFVVLMPDVDSPDEALRVAQRLVDEFRRPFLIEARELFVTVSIGIAFGTARTTSPEVLLRDADIAMYRAKEEGAGYRMFEPEMYERAVKRLETENDLRRAVEAWEFVVHYQPIFGLRTGATWGVEALLRWDHPRRGLLEPLEFMPALEETGLVVPVGERVLEETCRQARAWRDDPRIPPSVVSVNLSAEQLRRSDLARSVEEALRKTGLEASSLSLDITETAYVNVLQDKTAALERLKKVGVGISIDDFGVGYSSLSYLKRLPADILKIDRSFVRGLGEDVEDTAIVRMVIELAHILGMEVVAEGVESADQLEQLREMGCDLAQGFYFAEARSGCETSALLSSGSL